MLRLLSDADRALGRLDGVTSILPNPDLFLAMYVRHEAVLSSQIEGTQSTLEDILQYQVDEKVRDLPKDVDEVVNYVDAMNYGLDRLKRLPLSKRLIREIHARLLKGTRGGDKTPGEFRRTQNWIGEPDCRDLDTAVFVPPPVHEMHAALDNLEAFLHDRESLPVLSPLRSGPCPVRDDPSLHRRQRPRGASPDHIPTLPAGDSPASASVSQLRT